MPADTASLTTRHSTDRRSWPFPARWLLTAFAFPPSGLLAISVVGPVDAPAAAVLSGAIVGAGIGSGQWLALRPPAPGDGRLRNLWIGTTAAAMAAGLGLGASVVGYETGTDDLVRMGLVTGALLGPAQAIVLHTTRLTTPHRAAAWAAIVPLLWGLGWFVTASAGVDVEKQYAVFGITGALTVSALGGLALAAIRRRRPAA